MKSHYPMLLPRTKAMLFANVSRMTLEKAAAEGKVRVCRTKGNHRRYFREDLNKHFNERLQKQPR
jgi:excisionase family DNA binding protein